MSDQQHIDKLTIERHELEIRAIRQQFATREYVGTLVAEKESTLRAGTPPSKDLMFRMREIESRIRTLEIMANTNSELESTAQERIGRLELSNMRIHDRLSEIGRAPARKATKKKSTKKKATKKKTTSRKRR